MVNDVRRPRVSVDPLMAVRQFLGSHSSHDAAHNRSYLLAWAEREMPGYDPELIADVLTAAGLGKEAEQGSTVYARASH